MAGRPRTMAKRLTGLEGHVVDALISLGKLYPAMYRDRDSLDSEPGYLWCKAAEDLEFAGMRVNELAAFYRKKTGAEEVGPYEAWEESNDSGPRDGTSVVNSPEYLI